MKQWITAAGLMLLLVVAFGSSFLSYGAIYASVKQKGPQAGCIWGSIGVTLPGKNFNAGLHFAPDAKRDTTVGLGEIGFTTMDKKHDFVEGNLRASTFRMCVKPGKYGFTVLTVGNEYSVERFWVPFEVGAGEERYIGSFVFHRAGTNRQPCPGAPMALHVEVRDESARDIPVIQAQAKSTVAPGVSVVDAMAALPYLYRCDLASSGN